MEKIQEKMCFDVVFLYSFAKMSSCRPRVSAQNMIANCPYSVFFFQGLALK